MKEFINKFKKLELTKKLVILFITISFIFILGITSYNALTNNFENKENVATKENIEENNNENEEKITNEEVKENVEEDDTNNKLENEVETVNRQDETNNVKEKNESTTNEKNISSNTEQSSNTVASSDNNENNQNNGSSSNQENSNNNNTTITAKETIYVHIQVIGMGETMMSGNLTVEKGSTAYSVLKEIATKNGKTVSGSTSYVTGIGGLNEKEHGAGSGWMYKVNGYAPPKPAIAYTLNNGDNVVWYYVNYE